MNKFSDLQAFTAVVEAGTFSAAGERLGIAKSVVSRRISQLENRLGSRLLHRTTRRLSLTDAGRNFYQRSVMILNDLDDAEQAVTQETTELRGSIKLAAPLSFGLLHLSTAIADFLTEHPAIELNLDLNDRNVNLVEDGFDLAIRIGHLTDSTLIARSIGIVNNVTCASHEYIEKHGKPTHPDDLSQHFGLQYSNITYKQQWRYQSTDAKPLTGTPQIRMRSNNGDSLAAAALAGLGITAGPTFILGEYIKTKRLVALLEKYRPPAIDISAVYPPGRLVPTRVRVLTEFLGHRFGDRPYWEAQEETSLPGKTEQRK